MSSYENVKWVVKPVCAFVNSNIPTGTCRFSKFSFNRNVTIHHIVLEPSGLSVRIIYCFTNLQHIVVVKFSDWNVVSRFVTKSEIQSCIACNQQMLDSKLCVNLCHFYSDLWLWNIFIDVTFSFNLQLFLQLVASCKSRTWSRSFTRESTSLKFSFHCWLSIVSIFRLRVSRKELQEAHAGVNHIIC